MRKKIGQSYAIPISQQLYEFEAHICQDTGKLTKKAFDNTK